MKKYNLVGYHFLTVENQRFKNMQQANPFLMQFKNAQESMKWHRKQAKEQREQLNALLMNRKKSDTEISDLDIIRSNTNYFQQLY